METVETNLFGNYVKAWFSWKKWQVLLLGFLGLVGALIIMAVSVRATMTATESGTETVLVSQASQAATKVEYYLPYPGILPDSPLYKLKAIRDRVKLWTTFNEGEKAKLELALADKRINAALALATGNKPELAITTATKAEKYLEQSVNRVIKLIKLGKDEKSQLLNLEKAIAKHGEILVEVATKEGESKSKALNETIMLNKLLGERVGQLKLDLKL